ncbi:MFS transporter [Nocardia otitidiscaviarum]|uniref:MFS transporter n=1 Tax=Nocardia otitidiscaviarum TaxID=1823 RepID=UPI001894C205|nr:MFS transporter [Nocardia otitidiscaviarum]MBF6180243.1 MFS transporter [Nocardia otitidiscaviarum]
MTNSTLATAADADGAAAAPLSHRRILTILSGLLLAVFLAALDQNIVSVAIVKIANSLHGFEEQAWATTAYLITATIATPLYGKLADIYGRKPCYLIAIGVFVIGSAACAFATSMYQLAGFRAVQGIGAGGLMSLALTIIGDIVPARERVRYQGYFMMVFGIATVVGPVLGGFFSDYERLIGLDGWRWVFLVNVPIGALALLVVAKWLDVPFVRQRQRIDWPGGLALTAAVVPLLIVAEQGRDWGWDSRRALLCYGIAAVGALAFLLIEALMREAALIPLRLFRSGTFGIAILAGFIVGIAMFGGITMVPLYLQVVRGYSPTTAGLLMLPLVLGIMVGAQGAGLVTKYTGRYKMLPVLGTFVMAVGAGLFARVEFDSPMWQIMVYTTVIGFGLGGCMQTLIIAAQNACPPADMGVSTAAATFFRQMGGTLGVAVFLTILFNLLPERIVRAFGGQLPPGLDGAGLERIQSDTTAMAALPAQLREPILIGFTESVQGVFWVATGVSLLACLVLMFMKEIPLLEDRPAPPVATPAAGTVLDADELPLTGRVRDRDDNPVPETVLTLIDQHGHQVSRSTGNAHGEYTIGAPEPGAYVLIVAAGGHQPSAVSVTVGHRPQRLDLTLPGAGELTGVVRSALRGDPLAGATITLTDPRGDVVGTAVTAPDGGYVCHGVVSGTYTLVAVADHMRPRATTLTVPDSGLLRHDVELAPMAVLTGFAWADEGRPVSDAQITVLDAAGDVTATTRTDATGHYTVPDLPSGEYTVVARGYPPMTGRVAVDSGEVTHDVRLGYFSDDVPSPA